MGRRYMRQSRASQRGKQRLLWWQGHFRLCPTVQFPVGLTSLSPATWPANCNLCLVTAVTDSNTAAPVLTVTDSALPSVDTGLGSLIQPAGNFVSQL